MERYKWSRADNDFLEVWAYIYIYIYIRQRKKDLHHADKSTIIIHKAFFRQPIYLTLEVDCRLRKMAPALSDILRIMSSLLVLLLLMFSMGAINLEAQDVSPAPDEGIHTYTHTHTHILMHSSNGQIL